MDSQAAHKTNFWKKSVEISWISEQNFSRQVAKEIRAMDAKVYIGKICRISEQNFSLKIANKILALETKIFIKKMILRKDNILLINKKAEEKFSGYSLNT